MSAFEELGVCPEIIQAINEDGWLLPTPVQADAIPLILGGGDVCVAAETGSGKTGAFGLPCLQIVHETLRNKALVYAQKTAGAKKEVRLELVEKDADVWITEDGMECKSDNKQRWTGARANTEILTGKYMFEVEITAPESLCRVGWAATTAGLELGKDDRSFGYGGTGKKSWNNSFEDYGQPFAYGDTIGCMLDRSDGNPNNHTITYAKNGVVFPVAFRLSEKMQRMGLKPGICGRGFQAKFDFTNFKHPISGYKAIGMASAADTSEGLNAALGADSSGRSGSAKPLCLILEPTKDLAEQTYKCMVKFGKYLDAPAPRTALFIGGGDEKEQRRILDSGVDIGVGTLQRVGGYVKEGKIDLSLLKFLVLDEADELFKNDEKNDISRIKMSAASKQGKVQTLFFSATLHGQEVKQAIDQITVRPTWVDLKGKPSIPDTVHVVCYDINPHKELPFNPGPVPPTDGVHAKDATGKGESKEQLSQWVKEMKPQVLVKIADSLKMSTCMVFCRTNLDCDNLEIYLNNLGGGKKFGGKMESGKESPYSCVVLAGMRDVNERRRNLEAFKQGDVRFLICTDVAARGIDIKELPFMVMLCLPDDEPDQFFHRVGRVGRADCMGLAVCVVATEQEKVWYHKCANRGRGCTNTQLLDKGGCCKWFNEPKFMKDIEEKVGHPIPRMHPSDLGVAGILDPIGKPSGASSAANDGRSLRHQKPVAAAAGGGRAQGGMLIYGKQRDDTTTQSTLKTLQDLAPAVHELRDLEKRAQQSFVALLTKGLKA